MEKETRMLLWGLFTVGVLTVGYVPAAWLLGQRTTAHGYVATTSLENKLWGSSVQVPQYVSAVLADESKVSIIPGATNPNPSVSFGTSTWGPSMTITGSGFGNTPPPDALTLKVIDTSRGWMAQNAPSGVTMNIQSWTNTKIVVSGFIGYGGGDTSNFADGLGSWVFAPNDQLTVTVTNPQTNNQGSFNTQYPSSAPMPTVSMSTSTSVVGVNGTVTVSAHVAFAGTPMANQAVNFSAPAGTFAAPGGSQVSPPDYIVFTDANGNATATYTAPSSPGTEAISVMSDAVIETSNVNVVGPPTYQSVNWNTSVWPPQVTITGSNFGPTAGNVELYDTTHGTWWDNTGTTGSATNPPGAGADQMTASWSDSSITLSNFNAYGQPVGWVDQLLPGDAITIYVQDVQTGETSSYNTTFPSNATMPVLTMNGVSTTITGQTATVSGQVMFNDSALANQVVTLSVGSGSFSGSSSINVTTNAQGQFSTTFTAPGSAGTYTITGVCDNSRASTSIPVVEKPSISGVSWNTSTWAPQPTISGSGFGSSAGNEYVQIVDNTRSWQGGTSGSAVVFTVGTWNENTVTVTNMSNYGGGSGGWIFAPGDSLTINVTNPQSGLTGSYNTTYPSYAQMASVSINGLQSMQSNASQAISGRVTLNGEGLAYQTVTLSTNGGSFGSNTVTTDANGNWSDTYNSPSSGGTYTITASSDGGSSSTNAVALPQFSVSLSGYATSQYGFSFTATTNNQLSTSGYQVYIGIYDITTGQWVASSSSGTSLTGNISIGSCSNAFVAYVTTQYANLNTVIATSNQETANPGYYYYTSVWVNGTCTTTQNCTTQNVCTTTQSCQAVYSCPAGSYVDPYGFCFNGTSEVSPIARTVCTPVTTCTPQQTCTPVTTCTQGYYTTQQNYSQPYVTSP